MQRLRGQFHVEYGTDIDDFLDTVYLAGADLGGTELEHHARCIERSHKMLTLVQNAEELLRTATKTARFITGCCITLICPPSNIRTQRKSLNSFSRISGISAGRPTFGNWKRLWKLSVLSSGATLRKAAFLCWPTLFQNETVLRLF